MRGQKGFNPKILGFLCNWCSYAGADLAGVSRYQYPPNIRVIRVMCSGRIDPTHILEAFIQGIDGVMVLGCHPGDCHYITGNYYTEGRMHTLQTFLEIVGVKPERLLLDWVSASEGERFATLVSEFTKKITRMGPLVADGLKDELHTRLMAAREAFSQHRTRWLINRERDLLTKGNVFGETVDPLAYKEAQLETLVTTYEQQRILYALRDQVLSVPEIAEITAFIPQNVLRHLILLEQNGRVTVSRIDGVTPRYQRMGDEDT